MVETKILTHHVNFVIEYDSAAAVFGVHHGTQLCPLICNWIVLQKAVTEAIWLIIYTVKLNSEKGRTEEHQHTLGGFS